MRHSVVTSRRPCAGGFVGPTLLLGHAVVVSVLLNACGGDLPDSPAPGVQPAGGGAGGTSSPVRGTEAEGGAAGSDHGAEYPPCEGPAERFVSVLLDHSFGSGQDFGQDQFPDPIMGPPQGGGESSGGLHVVSLGEGGFVEFGFEGNVIVDEPGPDFLIFENAFIPAGGSEDDVFAELAHVSVSQDGEHWYEFSCAGSEYPYTGCAGWHPVLANAENNDSDPFDPAEAGGDPFDLADVGLEWARYVRIEDELDDAGTTFDFDAAAIIHPGCQ